MTYDFEVLQISVPGNIDQRTMKALQKCVVSAVLLYRSAKTSHGFVIDRIHAAHSM